MSIAFTIDEQAELHAEHVAGQTRHDQFCAELERQYAHLFRTDADYEYAASRNTPSELARKMTNALACGSGSKEGKGVKRTCKALGIGYTYKAIRQFLS